MAITPLPPAPLPTDSTAQFNTKAFEWVASLEDFVTETNATAVQTTASKESAALSATASANSATASANSASASATSANASATSAETAAAATNAVLWVSGTTYAIGFLVYSPIDKRAYRRLTAGAGTTDPSADATNWSQLTRVVEQSDIGTAPNEIPLNQYLGDLAYQDAENIAGDVGVGGDLTLNSGTANGVTYLNGSKVLTSGSGLAYNSDGILFVNSSLVASSTTLGLQLRFNGTVAGISASQSGLANYPIHLGGDGFTSGLYIDASSNVGVGTTSPATFAPFAVRKSLAIGGVSTSASFSDAVYSTFDIRHTTGVVNLNAQAASLSFDAGGTERARIDSAGHLIVPEGITLGTTAGTYNAANTLDDYEEGTWTPAQGSGLTVVGAFTSSGKYTRTGRVVVASGIVSGETSVAITAGNELCTGFPFSLTIGSHGIATNQYATDGAFLFMGGASVFSATTIAATGNIQFTLTYTI